MVGVVLQSQCPLEQRLAYLHRLCQGTSGSKPEAAAVPTRWGIDPDLPQHGLARGKAHEWLGLAPADGSRAGRAAWSPPLHLLTDLACTALVLADNTEARLIWIGRNVWPYAPVLGAPTQPEKASRHPLDCSLFVHASSPAQRLWATDLALRSRAAVAVIADASGFDLPATRRLQLAAEAGNALCLLARPPWEQSILSASTTRWLVHPCPSPTLARRWTVSLLRCKGVQPGANRLWTLERDHATRAFAVVPDLRDRSRQTQAEPIRLSG